MYYSNFQPSISMLNLKLHYILYSIDVINFVDAKLSYFYAPNLLFYHTVYVWNYL